MSAHENEALESIWVLPSNTESDNGTHRVSAQDRLVDTVGVEELTYLVGDVVDAEPSIRRRTLAVARNVKCHHASMPADARNNEIPEVDGVPQSMKKD
jgi:hypothetical protein